MSEATTSTLLAWLATYAIHSTILLTAAWILVRVGIRGARAREVLWRTALWGALVTATVQAFGSTSLPGTRIRGWIAAAPTDVASPTAPSIPLPVDLPDAAATPVLVRSDTPHTPAATTGTAPKRAPLLLVWALVAGVLLLRRWGQHRRFATRLARRREVGDQVLLDRVRALARDADLRRPVRLTSSPKLASAIAFGVLRPEICVPERALRDLDAAELDAMLAHEVAHLRRGDPWRMRVEHALAALLFFQPLHRLALRDLEACAELLCDAWAAREDARRLALASCLARVADWILEAPPTPSVPTMARRASLLGVRVGRLLDPAGAPRDGLRLPARALALTLVVLVAVAAPGVAAQARAAPPPTPTPVVDPLVSLRLDLDALAREAGDVQSLLLDAGHPDLANRIARRLDVLRARHDALVRRLGVNGDDR